MKEYKFDGYTMTLTDTGRKGEYGKARVAYTFSSPEGVTIFKSEDLFCSPMHTPEGLDNAKSLLTFLTLRKGDTDEDYFKDYTPEQIAFSESMDCENLQSYTMDDLS